MYSVLEKAQSLGVIALVLSIAAVILAFIFIVPEKKRPRLNKFCRFLHDTFNFKYLIIEKLLQAFYIFLTAFVFIIGFLMLFCVEEGYYSNHWLGGYGILMMILGPIFVRLIYELLMMAILVVKNVISINSKLKGQEGSGSDPFAAPDLSAFKNMFQQPQQQNYYQQNAGAFTSPVQNNDGQQSYSQPQGQQAAPSYVYCPNCGNVVEAGTFCTKCGTKV